MMFSYVKRTAWLLSCLLLFTSVSAFAQQEVNIEQAVELAISNDPWRHQNSQQQQALEYLSEASGQLPDPQLSLSMLNLPVDSWSLNQEPMTQMKVAVSQMFPRGDTLALKRSKLHIEASKHPFLLENRIAQVSSEVTQLWLDAYQSQMIIQMIENERDLFAQMADIARASYSSALGKTRQADVIRAQLELVQLDDRLSEQEKNRDMALARLNEWLATYSDIDSQDAVYIPAGNRYTVALQQPNVTPVISAILSPDLSDPNQLAQLLMQHPAVKAIETKYQVHKTNIAIAKQGYKPQWGVNASYGYRDSASNGSSRADFFSVGVSMDLPLFTEQKQDKEVSASIAQAQAVKTEKLLLVKNMLGGIDVRLSEIKRLGQRAQLYESQLLQQSKDQAAAALNAYTHDDGDFAEVVRAKIAELNMRITKLKIDIATQKSIAGLNYFLTQSKTATLQGIGE